MMRYSYPDYRSHREEHREFADELHFLKEDLRNIKTLGLKGSYELSVETVHIISDWISQHIRKEDRKLGEFLGLRVSGHDCRISVCSTPAESVRGNIVTVCSICKKIRSDRGTWKQRGYFRALPREGRLSHGLCPECLQNYYADLFQEIR
jgi:hypothetical protein